MNNFKIYVACLAAYNSGKLHGTWIELNDCNDADDIQAKIDEMLKASPESDAEEWAIHDHELPSCFKGEHFDLDELIAINECDMPDQIAGLMDYGVANNVEDAIKYHDDNYTGEYKSDSDYAEEYLESTGALNDLPDIVKYHIDYKSLARDLMMDMIEIDGHYYYSR
jgi:antirestriction protein